MFRFDLIQLNFQFFVNLSQKFQKHRHAKTISTNTFNTFKMIVHDYALLMKRRTQIAKKQNSVVLNQNDFEKT